MICRCTGGYPYWNMEFKRRIEYPPLNISYLELGTDIADCTYCTIISYWECPNCGRVVEENQETNR